MPHENERVDLTELRAGRPYRVYNDGKGTCVAEHLRLALTAPRRLRGLLFDRALDRREGLLIAPCRSVHTFFMRYAIDVLFLDRQARIVAMHEGLRPWRVTPYHRAEAVLELVSGQAAAAACVVGDRVVFVEGE